MKYHRSHPKTIDAATTGADQANQREHIHSYKSVHDERKQRDIQYFVQLATLLLLDLIQRMYDQA